MNKIYFSLFWSLRSRRLGTSRFGVRLDLAFWFIDTSHGGRGKGTFSGLLYKVTNLLPQRYHILIPSHWILGFQYMNLGEEAQMFCLKQT